MLSTHAASINMQNCTACLISSAHRVQGFPLPCSGFPVLELQIKWLWPPAVSGQEYVHTENWVSVCRGSYKRKVIVVAPGFSGSFKWMAECVSGCVCVSPLGLFSKGLVVAIWHIQDLILILEFPPILTFYWSSEHFNTRVLGIKSDQFLIY